MWISSLVLFVPKLAVCIVVDAIGLLLSVAITYCGMYALFRMRENLRAMQMATRGDWRPIAGPADADAECADALTP